MRKDNAWKSADFTHFTIPLFFLQSFSRWFTIVFLLLHSSCYFFLFFFVKYFTHLTIFLFFFGWISQALHICFSSSALPPVLSACCLYLTKCLSVLCRMICIWLLWWCYGYCYRIKGRHVSLSYVTRLGMLFPHTLLQECGRVNLETH